MVRDLIAMDECDALAKEITKLFEQRKENDSRVRGGLRNVLRLSPLATAIATSRKVVSIVGELLGGKAFPVRAILFDKTSDANWGVPCHQDLAIAVVERIDTPGFGPWSIKDGTVHVQPPPDILGGMITIRLHLDDCAADNGALRVLPGSHLHGELSTEAISDWASRQSPVICESPKGGVLLMRPLLLHASSSAKNPSHRRVLHVEYSTTMLPNGLEWSENS